MIKNLKMALMHLILFIGLALNGTFVNAQVTAVNGICGTSNGSYVPIPPSANLCNAGTATTVSGTGPWFWNCNGLNGGAAALNCYAINQYQSIQNIDLRSYFPTSSSGVWYNYNHAAGDLYSTYGFYSTSPGLQGLYNQWFNLKKSGQLYTWIKAFNANGQSVCIATYDNLFLGSDLSVTEVGDWMSSPITSCTPSIARGYQVNGQPSGLVWAAPGGLRTTPLDYTDASAAPAQAFNLAVAQETVVNGAYGANGSTTWDHVQVLEVLPTYTPPYGRSATYQWGEGKSQTYNNVIHIIFYHGVSAGGTNPAETTCYQDLDPNWTYSKYYYHLPGFNTYASEYYMARGVGIIQQTTLLYNENNPNISSSSCTGMILQSSVTDPNHTAAQQAGISYIDYS